MSNQPWTFTDSVVDEIDRRIVQPPWQGERGGALFGPPGTRLVTTLLMDPELGTAANYRHSRTLRKAVRAFEQANPTLAYHGSIHLHPGGFAEPSNVDARTFRIFHDENPHIHDMIFPIAVRIGAAGIGSSARFGTKHLIDLPFGLIAAFTSTPDGAVVPVPVSILPIAADCAAAAESLAATATGVGVVPGTDGLPWLRVDFQRSQSSVNVLFPLQYPAAAPLIAAAGRPSRSPSWQPGDDRGAALARALEPALRTPVDVSSGIRARLAHHLPTPRPWNITVIGVGSVGSYAAELLVRSGIETLTLIDPDDVEPTNLSRSTFVSGDIGTPKVHALADHLRAINPGVAVTEVAASIQDHPEAVTTFTGSDLVMFCSDDLFAEAWANHVTYQAGVPSVSIKLFAKADAGKVLMTEPDAATACLGCMSSAAPNPTTERASDYGTGRLVSELALGPDIFTLTTHGVKTALALLARRAGPGPLTQWVQPLIDGRRTLHLSANTAGWGPFAVLDGPAATDPYSSLWVQALPRPDCPVCGNNPEPARNLMGTVDQAELDDFVYSLRTQSGLSTATVELPPVGLGPAR